MKIPQSPQFSKSNKTNKMSKKYPMDGPPAFIQTLMSKGKKNLSPKEKKIIREWLKEYKKSGKARQETLEAYAV